MRAMLEVVYEIDHDDDVKIAQKAKIIEKMIANLDHCNEDHISYEYSCSCNKCLNKCTIGIFTIFVNSSKGYIDFLNYSLIIEAHNDE